MPGGCWIEINPVIFSNHNGIILELNNKRKSEKNHKCMENKLMVKEEIKRDIIKFLKTS
jgi:hypothetical protein